MEKMSMSVRIKLSVMMFLQFMLFAVWSVPLAAYLKNIGVGGKFIPWILSTMAFGCMAAPVIGMFADRHFASQKILAVLNIATAVLLFVASTQTDSMLLFIVLLAAMLCYMPTWALTSSIAMTNSPAELFPQIRVFGSIGWVAAGLFSIIAIKVFKIETFDGTKIPLLCGAICSLIAAGVNFTLPNTPPPAKGQKTSVIDALGLRAVTLMKDPNFAIFIVISTLVMIPFTIYFSYCSMFLQDKGFEYITVTMNWGQFAEMFFMLLIPLALARMGIKWALMAGLVALLVRYIAFWCGGVYDMQWLYFVGILVHGIIFGFFIVGGQIYVDKKASEDIRAQAQGFMFLTTFGVGMVLGNFFNGALISKYSKVVVGDADSQVAQITTYDWDSIWKVTTIISAVLLAAFLVLFRDKFAKPGEGAVKEAVKEIAEEEIV